MAEATTFPVGNRVVRNWMPPRQRALGNSIMFLGTSLASAITAPLVSLIMLRFGWPTSFYLTATLTLVVSIVWMWRARDYPTRRDVQQSHAAAPSLPAFAPVRGPLLRNRNVWLLTISYVSEGYVLFIFVFWLYIYLVEKRGFSLLRGGWMAAIPWLVAMAVTPLGGVVCDRIAMRRGRLNGARAVIMVGYLLSGALLFVAAWAGNRTISVAALSISVAALMTSESSFWSSASYLAGTRVGVLSGVMNTVGILGGIGSTLLVPFLVQRFGWMPALATGTVMAILCSVLWVGVREVDSPGTRG
jgi:ACS family glucarate transporter-like MFS transporter